MGYPCKQCGGEFSKSLDRQKELEMFCSQELRLLFEQFGGQLIDYGQLKRKPDSESLPKQGNAPKHRVLIYGDFDPSSAGINVLLYVHWVRKLLMASFEWKAFLRNASHIRPSFSSAELDRESKKIEEFCSSECIDLLITFSPSATLKIAQLLQSKMPTLQQILLLFPEDTEWVEQSKAVPQIF